MQIYMTNPMHGAMHVYSESEALANEKNGWVRAQWPPPPKVVVSAEPAPEVVESIQTDIEALRIEARTLGIKVDGRWSVIRLQDEIENAKS